MPNMVALGLRGALEKQTYFFRFAWIFMKFTYYMQNLLRISMEQSDFENFDYFLSYAIFSRKSVILRYFFKKSCGPQFLSQRDDSALKLKLMKIQTTCRFLFFEFLSQTVFIGHRKKYQDVRNFIIFTTFWAMSPEIQDEIQKTKTDKLFVFL